MGAFNLSAEDLADLGLTNSTYMQYGKYTFTPIPLISMGKEITRTPAGLTLSEVNSMTLQGTLTTYPTGAGSISDIVKLQDDLKEAFAPTGLGAELIVRCGESELIAIRPVVKSINFAEGTWVDRSDYTIELEYYASGDSAPVDQVRDFSETFSIEKSDQNCYSITWLDDDNPAGATTDAAPEAFTVTHSISAVGVPEFDGGGIKKQAHVAASGFIKERVGYNALMEAGILQNTSLGFEAQDGSNAGKPIVFNQSRSVQIDKNAGSYSVTDTYTLYPDSQNFASGVNTLGAHDAWNADVSKTTDSSLVTVSLAGTITGSASGTFGGAAGYSAAKCKYENAADYFAEFDLEAASFQRARYFADAAVDRDIAINRNPVSTSIGHNPSQGTISYSFVFDTRPSGCLENALKSEIQISETKPNDVYAELTVLGRTSGPVLQSMGTITSSKRDVSLDATMPVGIIDCACTGVVDTSPSADAQTLMEQYRPDNCGIDCLTIFKHTDTENWNPTTGKYSRQMGWTYTTCEDCP